MVECYEVHDLYLLMGPQHCEQSLQDFWFITENLIKTVMGSNQS